MIFHKKDENPSKETNEELGWRERRSQQSEDVEITDVNDNDDKVWDAIVKNCFFYKVDQNLCCKFSIILAT